MGKRFYVLVAAAAVLLACLLCASVVDVGFGYAYTTARIPRPGPVGDWAKLEIEHGAPYFGMGASTALATHSGMPMHFWYVNSEPGTRYKICTLGKCLGANYDVRIWLPDNRQGAGIVLSAEFLISPDYALGGG